MVPPSIDTLNSHILFWWFYLVGDMLYVFISGLVNVHNPWH
jgi:hypothetical protein